VTYSEAIQFLHELRSFGANFGLENTFKLAAQVGNPQERLRFIHVAGTNGKGSTCAMLESIYRASGLRVGLFTSPHLISFRERIQVNRQLISENDIARLVKEFQPLLKQFSENQHPTFFEVMTVMALKFFAEEKCDLVIWETGLGGRLDATNIVTPLASSITNIAFDHQQWLGDTLEKIAAEKAGIIKPGIPVVTTTNEPKALAVIEKIAREKIAPLLKVNSWKGQSVAVPKQFGSPAWRPSLIENLPLLGGHQKLNAALALAIIATLQNKILVSEAAIRAGLEGVNWPGRLQLVKTKSGQSFLLDGAHNMAGAKVLREALVKNFSVAKRTLILGVLQDKDWRQICQTLAPLAARIFPVPVSSERSAAARELAAACRVANPKAEIISSGSLGEALKRTTKGDFVVITGSLYLVGEALELLKLLPMSDDERTLNEWSAPSQPVWANQ
jgi:dihydrofolate synthase/folylpolyglutamate synthase